MRKMVIAAVVCGFASYVSAQTAVTLQDGSNTYSGCEDSYISNVTASSNYGSFGTMRIHRN